MITWAGGDAEFQQKARMLCDSLELLVEDVEDSMPLVERQKSATLDDELQALIDQAKDNPSAILYGTFHS